MLSKIINKIKRKLGFKKLYPSETSRVRHLVIDYCKGKGCDIGFGGDKVKEDCVGIDFANPYAATGKDKVDIACNVMQEPIPVEDGAFDYVYSSHLIEDFEDTAKGLVEFIRILRNKGYLILVFPDQKKYEETCSLTGQPLNTYHKHSDMGLKYMLNALSEIKDIKYETIFQSDKEIDYNVILVLQVFKYGKN